MSRPVILWLRQDLRLADHPALTEASAAGELLFLYVLDDDTPGPWCMGAASRWWLHHSLESLSRRIPLTLRRGRADRVIGEVVDETGAAAVYFTRDYGPWSGALERRVKEACQAKGAACHRFGGFLLHEPESIRTGQNEPYKVYTPFSRACMAKGEPRPARQAPKLALWSAPVRSDTLSDWRLLPVAPNWAQGLEGMWEPGEEGAKRRLAAFIESGLADYASHRDRPDRDVTSRLSPHLHFGEVSPIQCWQAVRAAQSNANGRLDAAAEKFLKEMLWREFSYHLLHHWPDLPEQPFKPEYAEFPWVDDCQALSLWQKGLTGYPIVDAGMRELWTTGTMHNRVRMIAASFLIKDLLIPWQDGERWFWDTLVDADIANNAASWQWVAGCGADAAPYFRIFNPVLQGEKFDPQGGYVRRWLPELARLPDDLIHRPWEAAPALLRSAGVELGATYPLPIVEHARARDRALAALKSMKGPSP
ncbi:MAG: deoxyribodipyrimidine photo-lyase [Alphaproteobacteria bacterium]|nr:deoxyribodipyrimidine photo-lyase [Alphaproteobacteria bacterium]